MSAISDLLRGDKPCRICAYVLLTEFEGCSHTAADSVPAPISPPPSCNTTDYVQCYFKRQSMFFLSFGTLFLEADLGLINNKDFKLCCGVKDEKKKDSIFQLNCATISLSSQTGSSAVMSLVVIYFSFILWCYIRPFTLTQVMGQLKKL